MSLRECATNGCDATFDPRQLRQYNRRFCWRCSDARASRAASSRNEVAELSAYRRRSSQATQAARTAITMSYVMERVFSDEIAPTRDAFKTQVRGVGQAFKERDEGALRGVLLDLGVTCIAWASRSKLIGGVR